MFAPCDTDERWWVVNEGDLVSQYKTVAEQDYEQVFARVRGTISEPGEYGHGGEYPREIEITRVLQVREQMEGDCE